MGRPIRKRADAYHMGLPYFYEIFQKCRSGTFHRKEMEKSMEQLLQVGVITQTHGIRGEVKVFPTTDDLPGLKD